MHDAHHSAKIDINPQQDWEFWTDASGAPVSAVFLASQLQALLNIAKPEDAAALVDSLVRDLARLQLLLTAAGRRQDWARIEEQTGILISISAAIGADLLMEAGHTLRFVAENRLPDLLASGLPSTLRAIAALRRGIRIMIADCQAVS